ncbi:uncharacterized protein B0I36DRAFT_328403 [Microdochium trichocladiopsis]|uniref:Uncharacterized protein n=1 Tax=Microdochium trichocladiopsis TaxID=1682393 RepID=A0A9P8Y2H5_9PEZI|nr:uncharacterized protein B0I36DRAFT_328403 [Microdochium trichocladiopsis]KAH7027990.1 hypothetical protein B0I36DRAFT_328403 [Microdochium trichocladiopsis]
MLIAFVWYITRQQIHQLPMSEGLVQGTVLDAERLMCYFIPAERAESFVGQEDFDARDLMTGDHSEPKKFALERSSCGQGEAGEFVACGPPPVTQLSARHLPCQMQATIVTFGRVAFDVPWGDSRRHTPWKRRLDAWLPVNAMDLARSGQRWS